MRQKLISFSITYKKYVLSQKKRTPFSTQKDSFCNPKGLLLKIEMLSVAPRVKLFQCYKNFAITFFIATFASSITKY